MKYLWFPKTFCLPSLFFSSEHCLGHVLKATIKALLDHVTAAMMKSRTTESWFSLWDFYLFLCKETYHCSYFQHSCCHVVVQSLYNMVTTAWLTTFNLKHEHKTWAADRYLGSVVRRPDSAIHWIAKFSTFVKLAVHRKNLR